MINENIAYLHILFGSTVVPAFFFGIYAAHKGWYETGWRNPRRFLRDLECYLMRVDTWKSRERHRRQHQRLRKKFE